MPVVGEVTMTDKEFEDLNEDLEKAEAKLERLKKLYKQQTGQTWVRPLRLERPIWARRGGNDD